MTIDPFNKQSDKPDNQKLAERLYSNTVWKDPNHKRPGNGIIAIMKLLLDIIDILRDIRYELKETRIHKDSK